MWYNPKYEPAPGTYAHDAWREFLKEKAFQELIRGALRLQDSYYLINRV